MDAMALIGRARAAGISWHLEGESLRVRVPKTAAHLLEELRAHRTKVEAVILGELMFDGRAIHVGEFLAVKQFATERAALEYVDRFTYGRRLCGLEPLIVARSADGFSVLNPDYPTARFKLDTGGRVKRDG